MRAASRLFPTLLLLAMAAMVQTKTRAVIKTKFELRQALLDCVGTGTGCLAGSAPPDPSSPLPDQSSPPSDQSSSPPSEGSSDPPANSGYSGDSGAAAGLPELLSGGRRLEGPSVCQVWQSSSGSACSRSGSRYGRINDWDISEVTELRDLFTVTVTNSGVNGVFSALAFNQTISRWNVAKVTDMQGSELFSLSLSLSLSLSHPPSLCVVLTVNTSPPPNPSHAQQ